MDEGADAHAVPGNRLQQVEKELAAALLIVLEGDGPGDPVGLGMVPPLDPEAGPFLSSLAEGELGRGWEGHGLSHCTMRNTGFGHGSVRVVSGHWRNPGYLKIITWRPRTHLFAVRAAGSVCPITYISHRAFIIQLKKG
jgi:hypothetical protein